MWEFCFMFYNKHFSAYVVPVGACVLYNSVLHWIIYQSLCHTAVHVRRIFLKFLIFLYRNFSSCFMRIPVSAFHALKHWPLVPFTFTAIQLAVRCRCLYILLYHTHAFVLCNKFFGMNAVSPVILWHWYYLAIKRITISLFSFEIFFTRPHVSQSLLLSQSFIFFKFYFLSMYIWFYSCFIM
jgi:hypothetical protein